MKIVELPSGKKLAITPAPFAEAKALYQAMLDEMKSIDMDMDKNVTSIIKDLFCLGFSSKKIESCLNECMKRATIDGIKISADTFEPVEARQDYMEVCFEVALENILPFTKSLYAKYQVILKKLESIQA